MAFSKRAEELRIGNSVSSLHIPCLAQRGALVTETQCSARNRSFQQNTRVCVSCPRRLCPHCVKEGRADASLATISGACADHEHLLEVVTVTPSAPRFGKFTPSEESYQKEQDRPVVRAGCGALNDHSLIDYHSLIER